MPENGMSEAEYALFSEWFYATKESGFVRWVFEGWDKPPPNNASLLTNALYKRFLADTGFKGDLSQVGLASYAAEQYEDALKAIKAGRNTKEAFDVWYNDVLMAKQVESGKVDISALPDFTKFRARFEARRESDIKTKGKLVKGGFTLYEGKAYKDVGGIPVEATEAYEEYLEDKGLAREKFEWEKSQARKKEQLGQYAMVRAIGKEQREAEEADERRRASLRGAPGSEYWEPRALALRLEQEKWLGGESARDQRLSSLTSHKDWIARWQTIYGTRYYPTPAPLQTKAYQAQYNINKTREEAQLGSQLWQKGEISPEQYEASQRPFWVALEEGQPWIAQQQEVARTGQGILGTAGRYWGAEKGGESLSDVGNPPVPAWLSKFAPGQRRTISRENIPTPSAQLWARTSPSEKQALEGYLDWVNEEAMNGRTMEDILWEMNRMRTGTPSRQAWLPARQRV